jgi:hypothetical protein
MKDQKNQTDPNQPINKTPKVTGIGGIFFFSNNPQETKDWYAKNLGLEINEWGSSFESRDINKPDTVNANNGHRLKKEMSIFLHPKKIL